MSFVNNRKNSKNLLNSVLAVITLVVGELLYFYEIIFGGKTLGLGSDGLLINLMLEHWYDVFQGELSFDTLRMFYPQTETLGYSDMLLGPGVIFALLRFCGGDFFASLNSSLVLLHGIGVGFLYLTLREAGCSRKGGILGVLISFWSCSYSQLTWHLQFFSLSYISIALYGTVLYYKNLKKGIKWRLFYLFIISIGMGGAFLSSFYIAYETCLLAGFTAVLFGIHFVFRKKSEIGGYVKRFYKYRWDCITGVLLQIPWLLIFVKVYLSAYKQLGTYDPELTLSMAPMPTDLFRTMSYAPVESWIRSFLPFRVDYEYHMLAENIWFERSNGWPLVTVLLLIGFLFYMMKNKRAKEKNCLVVLKYTAISMLILFFLSAKYGDFCPWAHIISKIIPGAAAIRVPGRCLGIYVIPLALCICVWLSELELTVAGQRGIIAFEMLIFILLGFTAFSKRYMRNDSEYYAQIVNGCTQPPDDCQAILIYSLSPDTIYTPEIQLITWMIADRFNVYSINGYTGNYPENWQLAYTDQHDYPEAVDYWLDQKEVTERTHVYAYILEANIWIHYEDLNDFAIVNYL